MSRIKYLKGECAHCGGHVEFPADSIGMTTDCPHCGKPTELALATPPEQPALSRRTIVWTLIAVFVLALGLTLSLVAVKRLQRIAATKKQPAPAPAAVANAPPPELD